MLSRFPETACFWTWSVTQSLANCRVSGFSAVFLHTSWGGTSRCLTTASISYATSALTTSHLCCQHWWGSLGGADVVLWWWCRIKVRFVGKKRDELCSFSSTLTVWQNVMLQVCLKHEFHPEFKWHSQFLHTHTSKAQIPRNRTIEILRRFQIISNILRSREYHLNLIVISCSGLHSQLLKPCYWMSRSYLSHTRVNPERIHWGFQKSVS